MARVGVARMRGNKGVYIDGLTEARAALASLPEAFREAAADTIEIGSRIILIEAARRVPVDTRKLKDSLGRNVRADGLQAAIGSGDYKAKFVEFGTDDTRAQPFLWPAYRKGVRFVRIQMKGWTEKAGMKVRVRGRVNKTAKIKATAAKGRK